MIKCNGLFSTHFVCIVLFNTQGRFFSLRPSVFVKKTRPFVLKRTIIRNSWKKDTFAFYQRNILFWNFLEILETFKNFFILSSNSTTFKKFFFFSYSGKLFKIWKHINFWNFSRIFKLFCIFKTFLNLLKLLKLFKKSFQNFKKGFKSLKTGSISLRK